MTRLREMVEVQADVSDDGSVSESWKTRKRLYASVRAVTGGEHFRGVQIEAQVSHVVDVNYHDWITPQMRLKYRGQNLNIEAVLDRDQRRRKLELHCSRVADDG